MAESELAKDLVRAIKAVDKAVQGLTAAAGALGQIKQRLDKEGKDDAPDK